MQQSCMHNMQGRLEAQVSDSEVVLPLYEPAPQVSVPVMALLHK